MIQPDSLQSVCDLDSLLDFLRDELNWPVRSSDQLYDFYADELALSGEASGKVGRVMQLASFEKGQPWGIFLVEYDGGKILRSPLHEVLRGLSASRKNRDAGMPAWQAPHLIFICTADYNSFSFAHYSGTSHTDAKLSLFGWKRGESSVRTLCEHNLPALQYPSASIDAEGWIRKWETAWDVEAATRRFYRDFAEVFGLAESQITGVAGGVEEKRLFTQGFFNRMLFIHFLSRKGWLRFEGSTDYLRALWQGRNKQENFYQHHLIPLFFKALCHPQARSLSTVEPSLHKRIGDVPYLNGGLFERSELDDKGESVPDRVVESIISLFGRYNFTVEESDVSNTQVAVDPEMLGKVFEELVNGRHESGSYYTPRGIVRFMCHEALRGYLGGYDSLVYRGDPTGISVPEAVTLLAQLKTYKVVDPACGSGAYLLGMLQELNKISAALDTKANLESKRDAYQRKLEIVQNNIYGVDLDPFAVNIARLRLWLSLAVDFEGDDPEPLPNLDFKVECGDSLAAPSPSGGVQPDMFRQQQIADFDVLVSGLETLKAAYANPYVQEDKSELRSRIVYEKRKIAAWLNKEKTVQGFDWRVEFAEVFRGDNPGFDAVVMNPPFVNQLLIIEQKPRLQAVYPEVYTGRSDLYCYFYARAIQLLRGNGMLAAITPNKWFRAGYGAKLRKHMAESCNVLSITDFGELPVFKGVATLPMVITAMKSNSGVSTPLFTEVQSLGAPYPDVAALQHNGYRLPPGALKGSEWKLADQTSTAQLRQMEAVGIPLKEYARGQIFNGIKTGFNKAFVIDGETRNRLIAEDERSDEIIKPLAIGDDVRRWNIRNKGRWLIRPLRGCVIEDYPAILKHLEQFRTSLEPKPQDWDPKTPWPGRASGPYKWYEFQGEPAYLPRFSEPKIVYPEMCQHSRFAFDTSGFLVNNKTFVIFDPELFLLGVMNSQSVWNYLAASCSTLLGQSIELRSIHVSKVPIPPASDADKAAISALVQKCLDAKGDGCEVWEKEIDERVAALYGL